MDREAVLARVIEKLIAAAADNSGYTDEEYLQHLCYCFSDIIEEEIHND